MVDREIFKVKCFPKFYNLVVFNWIRCKIKKKNLSNLLEGGKYIV